MIARADWNEAIPLLLESMEAHKLSTGFASRDLAYALHHDDPRALGRVLQWDIHNAPYRIGKQDGRTVYRFQEFERVEGYLRSLTSQSLLESEEVSRGTSDD